VWSRNDAELQRGIEAARIRFGDGPYLLVSQTRLLDIDGFADSLALVSSHADVASGRDALAREFSRLCEASYDPAWSDEDPSSVPVAVADINEVRLVEERRIKRKDESRFNAYTHAVQLLEISHPPVIGEPLFRALGYADELATFLRR
jgi:hypothetical protein